jgi:hypothetical protein
LIFGQRDNPFRLNALRKSAWRCMVSNCLLFAY